MEFYSRKLHNVDDLEAEKRKLLKKKRHMDKEPFLSLSGVAGKEKKGGGEESSSLLSFLPVSGPVVSIITKLVSRQFGKRQAPSYKAVFNGAAEKPGRNILRSVAMDMVTGYLKWKAIELSIKGVQKLIDKRREKNAAVQRRKRSGIPH
jgi:hypothetical protein